MIRIDPTTIYTRSDLLAMFGAIGIDWDALRAKIQPRKVTRGGWLGQHVYEALRDAEPFTGERLMRIEPNPKTRRRGGPPVKQDQANELFESALRAVQIKGRSEA